MKKIRRNEFEKELLMKQRRAILWERKNILPDIKDIYNRIDIGT